MATDGGLVKKIHYMLKKIKNWNEKVGAKGENIFGAIEKDFDEFVEKH